MIAIAQNHVFQIALVPLVPVEMIVKRCLLLLPHVEGFIHDNEAQLIGQLEQLGRGWIVGSPNTVDAHRLQHLELPLQSACVNGSAECAKIMMIADTPNLYGLAVQNESFIDVETEMPNADRCFVSISYHTVNWVPVLVQLGHGPVQI